MPVPTFTALVERWSNSDMKEARASAFFGILCGVLADTMAEAMIISSRMHLLDDPESPDDALPLAAKDRRLPRYPLETAAQHRQRLIDAWDIYALGGGEDALIGQLRAAGYGPTTTLPDWGDDGLLWGTDPIYVWGDAGAYIELMRNEPGPRGEPAPYWSQFRVVFQPNFHPVFGPPTPWGEFAWGDTLPWVWTYAGYTPDHHRTIIGIIRKWKPSRWVCRELLFKVSEQIWGQNHPMFAWGGDGFFWGSGFTVQVPLS